MVLPNIPPPFVSWTESDPLTGHWIPPVPYPTDGKNYDWHEDIKNWVPTPVSNA